MSIRLAISVEGQTEERFIKDVLAPHLGLFGVYAIPVVVATSRSASGAKSKGGGINTDRINSELSKLLYGFSKGFVTSLYDFYGFEDRIPGENVWELENRISNKLGNPRNLITYVQLHEFEGLLLSDSMIVAEYFHKPDLRQIVTSTVKAAGGPEQVNNGTLTSPSKRLEQWTGTNTRVDLRYTKATKTRHAPQLAARLTLPTIRAACPRFHAWVERLERLGT